MDVGVGQDDCCFHRLSLLTAIASMRSAACSVVMQLVACRRNVEGQLGNGTQSQDAAATPVAVEAFASSQVCLRLPAMIGTHADVSSYSHFDFRLLTSGSVPRAVYILELFHQVLNPQL